MKIKFKMPPNHFNELLEVVEKLPFDKIPCSDLDIINLRSFWFEGKVRIGRMKIQGLQKKFPLKDKMFSIDVNHYNAIRNVISEAGDRVSPYTQSIVLTLARTAEPEISRIVSNYKLTG